MRTVGQILKEAREAKFLSLEEVEKHIKIRRELLEALEESNFSKLPPETFIRGFIKNYGKFLNLDGQKLLAIFRRDYETTKHPPKILDSFSNPITQKRFRLTPTQVLGAVVAIVILGFFAYLWFEYRQFVSAPDLLVNSPQDQQSVDIPTVTVSGKTDTESKVLVNDENIGVDDSGNFKEEINLSSSINKITISSTNKFGKTTTIERTVFVKKE